MVLKNYLLNLLINKVVKINFILTMKNKKGMVVFIEFIVLCVCVKRIRSVNKRIRLRSDSNLNLKVLKKD